MDLVRLTKTIGSEDYVFNLGAYGYSQRNRQMVQWAVDSRGLRINLEGGANTVVKCVADGANSN